jgi:hypothetical protein
MLPQLQIFNKINDGINTKTDEFRALRSVPGTGEVCAVR